VDSARLNNRTERAVTVLYDPTFSDSLPPVITACTARILG